MNIENIIKDKYNIPENDNLYISSRFYKKDSDERFCLYFVHRSTCYVIEFKGRYNPEFITEIWQGDNNGKGEFAPIIRQWTNRNIKWNFETQ